MYAQKYHDMVKALFDEDISIVATCLNALAAAIHFLLQLANIIGRFLHGIVFDIDLATQSAGIKVKFGLGRHLYADVSGDGRKMPVVIGNGLDVEIANIGCAFEAASGAAGLD